MDDPQVGQPDGLIEGVYKWLVKSGLTSAAEALQSETKLAVLDDNLARQLSVDARATKENIVRAWKRGDHDKFFEIWNRDVPEVLRVTDEEGSKMTFYIHIYFGIFPLLSAKNSDLESDRAKNAMSFFKEYLANSGADLAKTTEFLPYYALPYVPDPTMHPSFHTLFSTNWAPDLEQKLTTFLTRVFPTHSEASETSELVAAWKSRGESSKKGETEDALRREQQHAQELQQHLVECEDRELQLIRQHNSVLKTYHVLLGTAAELVDALGTCVSGGSVSTEFLAKVVANLSGFSNVSQSQIAIVPRPLTRAGIQPLAMSMERAPLSKLNHSKIRQDLLKLTDRNTTLLLQALRWRVTRSRPGFQRLSVLDEFTTHDILGVRIPSGPVYTLLQSKNGLVREYVTRLLNCLSSLTKGREYMLHDDLISALKTQLQAEEEDTLVRQNILMTLQKLSLRRHAQTVMIKHGLLSWLTELLTRYDELSEYSVEYSIALVMNLCFRSAGRRYCAKHCPKVLDVLSDMVGYENDQVLTNIHGALYSLLSDQGFRTAGRAKGLESVLKMQIQSSTDEMAEQLEYIVEQLNSNEPTPPDEEDEVDDNEADADNEDDDDDLTAVDSNEGESLDAADALVGEQLLVTEYLDPTSVKSRVAPALHRLKTPMADILPMRPTTPQRRADATTMNRLGRSGVVPVATHPKQPHHHQQHHQHEHHQPSRPVSARGASSSSRPPSSRATSHSRSGLRSSHSSHNTRPSSSTLQSRVDSSHNTRPTSSTLPSHADNRETSVSTEPPQKMIPQNQNPPAPSKKLIEAVAKQMGDVNTTPEEHIGEYNNAFSSRSKVPRTPTKRGH